MRPGGGVAGLEAVRLYSFGGLDDAARRSRVLEADPDADARSIHHAYARLGEYAAAPWDTLPEELRVSNRRVLTHLPAKLASLGFDLEPWLVATDGAGSGLPMIDPDERFFRDEADRRGIAELEHLRWMLDRRMNGWRYAPMRNDRRKFHPDLPPFDVPPPSVQAFDYEIADWIAENMPRGEGGLRRTTT